MPENKIGKIPEFTTDEDVENSDIEEVKEAEEEEISSSEKEKETPSELPAEEKPAQKEKEILGEDAYEKQSELEKALQSLQREKEKLLKEIVELRGKRREIKEMQLKKVESDIDELDDINPDDVKLVDRILRAKGFITREEASKMFYESVKQEQLNKFLEKYPEYKPENDPHDINWNALQKELSYYRMPEDPHLIYNILEKAHRSIQQSSSSIKDLNEKKHKTAVAGVGSRGVQKLSSYKKLDPFKRIMLEQGGWTKEEIDKIESQLPE